MTTSETDNPEKQDAAGVQVEPIVIFMTNDSKEFRKFVFSPCDLCSDKAVAMIKTANGCTCLKNIYQRRCMQHIIKLEDTDNGNFKIVEDYTTDQRFKI